MAKAPHEPNELEKPIIDEQEETQDRTEELKFEHEEGSLEDCVQCIGSRIEVAKDGEEFFWMLYAKNGRTIATSPHGYKRLSDLKKGIEAVIENIPNAVITRLY